MNIEQAKQIIANNIRAERTRARMSREETAEQLNITAITIFLIFFCSCSVIFTIHNLFSKNYSKITPT